MIVCLDVSLTYWIVFSKNENLRSRYTFLNWAYMFYYNFSCCILLRTVVVQTKVACFVWGLLISYILFSVCNVRPLTSAFGNQGIVHISIFLCNEKMWMRQSDICLCRNPRRFVLGCNACKRFPSGERGPKRCKI